MFSLWARSSEVCDSVSLPRSLGQTATKLKCYKISLQHATACEGQRDGKVRETRGHPHSRFFYVCMAILHVWSIFKLSLLWGTLLTHFLTSFSFPNSSKTVPCLRGKENLHGSQLCNFAVKLACGQLQQKRNAASMQNCPARAGGVEPEQFQVQSSMAEYSG